jgi:hypothetical protein
VPARGTATAIAIAIASEATIGAKRGVIAGAH